MLAILKGLGKVRTDGSLGDCINACGHPANYATTLECKNCYKKRRRRGIPPQVVAQGKHRYDFDRRPFKPRSDGRPSVYTQRLLEDARTAFKADSGYMMQVAEDAGRVKSGYALDTTGRWYPEHNH